MQVVTGVSKAAGGCLKATVSSNRKKEKKEKENSPTRSGQGWKRRQTENQSGSIFFALTVRVGTQ